jgi:hypothetical protein
MLLGIVSTVWSSRISFCSAFANNFICKTT